MPKYYVQCGSLEMIIATETPSCAALATLDRSLGSHLWIFDDPGLSDQNRRDHLMIEALLHLDPVVRISEIGMNRADAIEIGTPEIVGQWHELMTGMNRLFAAAGLAPRSMAMVAGVETAVDFAPRRPR